MSAAIEPNSARPHEGYRPEKPLDAKHPLFQWPPNPAAVGKFFFGFPGYLLPWTVLFIGFAAATWLYLTPDVATTQQFSLGWVATLLIRNLTFLVLFAGALHLRLYVLKAQGVEYKFNTQWPAVNNPTFLFGDQVWDNIFWNVCSAVPIWTTYEVVGLWLHANGLTSSITWQEHPVYFSSLFLLTPLWVDIHFFFTHRMLHWPPLYRMAHSVHHKNVNFGPWSGVAMHPIEHVVFFSAVTLFWIIPAHPVHAIFILLYLALLPSVSHKGFQKLTLGKKLALDGNDYYHYLHHKHVRVNYAAGFLPLDKWFGTLHDGSDEANEALKNQLRARARRTRERAKSVAN